jgi:4'-phosphopantetheinyl transferase
LPTEPERDTIDVLFGRIDAAPETVRASTALLSQAERERASRFAFARDRRRFVVARARLRRLIAARLQMRPEDVEITCGAHGKPMLGPGCDGSNLRFNLSHSGDVALFAICEGRDLGVDVERIRPLSDADDIASRFFSRREYAAYRALPPCDKVAGFFNCWTRKEAFLKAIGSGLDYPLDRFDVSLAPGEPARLFRVEDRYGRSCGWTLHALQPATGIAAALVVQRKAFEPRIRCRIDS